MTVKRTRFFCLVVGTRCGPHSPTFGCTRTGMSELRLRSLKMTLSLFTMDLNRMVSMVLGVSRQVVR